MKRALFILTLAGCGTAGGGDGGSENLPSRGIVPYEKGPMIVENASSPSARVSGGIVELYFEREGAIFKTSGDGERFGAAELFLENARQPSVSDDRLVFLDPEGAIVVAALSAPTVPLNRITSSATISGPSLAGELLYWEEGGAIVRDGQVVLADAHNAEIKRAIMSSGRSVYRMMYSALDAEGLEQIAFAASFDGLVFETFAFNPILSGRDPSNVRQNDRYLLYFVEEGSIFVAVNAPAAPGETF